MSQAAIYTMGAGIVLVVMAGVLGLIGAYMAKRNGEQ